MRRWLVALCLGGSVLGGLACADETVEEDVDSTICYSGKRWVGGKRGSEEMFPGRDCVGCHIDNDGPPFALGGTVYPYVLGAGSPGLLAQTGTDCFGIPDIAVSILDAEGLPLDVVTNRAGNFFVEGNPDDFAKPFRVTITWTNPATGLEQTTPMGRSPSYGGCGQCHNPDAVAPEGQDEMTDPPDEIIAPTARIGLPGYGPGANGEPSIQRELEIIGCTQDPTARGCDRILNPPD